MFMGGQNDDSRIKAGFTTMIRTLNYSRANCIHHDSQIFYSRRSVDTIIQQYFGKLARRDCILDMDSLLFYKGSEGHGFFFLTNQGP